MVCLKYSKKNLTIFWKAACVGAQQWWGWRKQCGFSDSFSHNSQLLQSKGTLVQDCHRPSLMISFFPLPLCRLVLSSLPRGDIHKFSAGSSHKQGGWSELGYEKKEMMYKEVLRELGMLSLEKRRMCVGEGSSCCPSLLMGDYKEDRVRFFSVLNKDKCLSSSASLLLRHVLQGLTILVASARLAPVYSNFSCTQETQILTQHFRCTFISVKQRGIIISLSLLAVL